MTSPVSGSSILSSMTCGKAPRRPLVRLRPMPASSKSLPPGPPSLGSRIPPILDQRVVIDLGLSEPLPGPHQILQPGR